MSTLWKKEEIVELQEMLKNGKSKEEIALHFGRTETAIEIKVNRLGLQLIRNGRNWLKSDLKEFANDWCDGSISTHVIMKKYKRSWFSIRKKALELGLGPRPYNDEYLSIKDICEEMQISHDRVSHWLKIGLVHKKNRSGKTKYLISQNDLLSFLKNHQDMFNASLISEYLFVDEPEWLQKKRKKDSAKYAKSNRLEYTNEEDKILLSMFNHGKSDAEIADTLNRTECGIAYHRRALGLCRIQRK